MTPTSFLPRLDGLRLAYRHRTGTGPTIVFLPGYMSDMQGSKAIALDVWAELEGRAMLRFDYSGCGESEGSFADGTLDQWRDDSIHLIDALTSGPIVLVGSSMGGWLMLLIALARPQRITALVGIAAAPDFTEWGYSDADKARIHADGILLEPSAYSDQPTPTTRVFWESGQRNRLFDTDIAFDGPIRLLHGQRDPDVPWSIAIRLADALSCDDVRTILIKDGDHRLSRDTDIALLIETVAGCIVA